MSKFFALSILISVSFSSYAQKEKWVDSVFSTLKKEEKIGQLFVVRFSLYEQMSPNERDLVKILAEKILVNKVGGLFIRTDSPTRYAKTINEFQSHIKTPLFIGADFQKDITHAFNDSIISFYGYQQMELIYHKEVEDELARERNILGLKIDYGKYFEFGFDRHSNGEPELKSFLSEEKYIITSSENIDESIKKISKTIRKDKTLASKLDKRVKEILAEKYDAGLAKNRFIDTDNLIDKLNSPKAKLLQQQLAHSLVALAKNDSNFLPIKNLSNKTFASISIGDSNDNEFTHYLSKYAYFKNHSIVWLEDTTVFPKLKNTDVIVVGISQKANWIFNKYSLLINQLKKLQQHHQVIICDFTKSKELESYKDFSSVVFAHSSEEGIPQAAAQIIFGGLSSKGELPIIDSLQRHISIKTDSLNRFSYQLPEAAQMDSRTLNKIESIANEAINMGATPGINVLVAKDGKVVYEKSFGSFTYDKKTPMTDETIFDLASITKVSATLQAVMYMQEHGMIDINKKASVYLPELKKSNKEDFVIKDIITHQAGLWPFLPFWAETVKDTSVWKKYYSKTISDDFPFPVAENMFASKSMKDSLWQWIIKAKIIDKTPRTGYTYRYSDMGFYIMQHIAEKLLNQPLEDFVQTTIYQPLGAYTTGYQPLRKFAASQIAPTEKDTLFRKSLLIGYVHDQGAAMHGGIAGHAGLFSDANDLAKLGQMWLNKGSYGGIQFFKPETIDLFTARQFENNRRGLGWDKPILNEPNISPTSFYSSAKTFGHTGFTGTSIWVDPEFNLVFVFLSNRVYPDMNNNKIINANIRPRIQDVVYQSIFEYCKNHPSPLPLSPGRGMSEERRQGEGN